MKKGFTIVELIMVVGIIGVLLGIVTTAASSSIKQSRQRKADACCTIIRQGLETYYAQEGKWPGSIGNQIENGSLPSRTNKLGYNNENDPNQLELEATEIDDMIRDLIQKTKEGNPVMDISGLFVSKGSGEAGSPSVGMDFMDAIHGTKSQPQKMSSSQMHFGYPDPSSGKFRRFKVIYSIPADTMKVELQ